MVQDPWARGPSEGGWVLAEAGRQAGIEGADSGAVAGDGIGRRFPLTKKAHSWNREKAG